MVKLHRPNNSNLPYFAYDAFKPRELAFPVINHFVDHIVPFELDLYNYELKHRNGIPMVVEDISTSPISGWLIYFNNNHVKVCKNKKKGDCEDYDAYDFICKTKPKSLFKWRQMNIDGIDFNIALGKEKDYGIQYKIFKGDYSGRNDPTFFELTDYIKRNIESMEIFNDYDTLYNLQMNYMLLWSAIDKYLFLCNGGWDQRINVVEWSKWEEFQLGIEYLERNNEIRQIGHVNSTNNNRIFSLNPSNPTSYARYYYQLRCNIVHSGKKENAKVSFIKDSLEELLKIFETTLNLSFYPERFGDYNISNWKSLIKSDIF